MGVRRFAGAAVRAGALVVAAAAWMPTLAAAADQDERPARILYFEPLRPLPAAADPGASKPGNGTLQQLRFDAFGRRFDIPLGLNGRLMESKPEDSSLELYRGSIDGTPGSWVRLARQGAVLHGLMWDGTQLYAIEPAVEVRDALADSLQADSAQTVVFRLADVAMAPGATSCATQSAPATAGDQFAALTRELKNAPVVMQAADATRRLDISTLGDSRFLEHYASEQAARDAILVRMNNVDGIYSSQLGIEVRVGSVSLPDAAHDQLSATTSPNGLLRELATLRRRTSQLNSQGLTHLFTQRDLDGSTIGIGYLDSLCDREHGVGLTESRNVWLDSLVAAHEIGHNFGADHDGDAQGSCPNTPSSGFLMAPVVSGADDFSSCSLNRMRARAQSASCITNLPPANVRIPTQLGAMRRSIGVPFPWRLQVTNTGGLSARNVRVELAVPPSLTIGDAYVVGGSCLSGAGAVACDLGDVAGGNVRWIELQLSSDVAGSNSIAAHLSADNDANRTDNDASGSVIIEAPADVSIALTGPVNATANQQFTVGFAVTNAASDAADRVTVQIDVPEGTTVNSASLANGNCTLQTAKVECTVAPLGGGLVANGSLSLKTSTPGNTTVRATVAGDYFDTNSNNDTADLVVTVGSEVSLATAPPAASGSGGGSIGLLLLLSLLPLQRRRLARRSSSY